MQYKLFFMCLVLFNSVQASWSWRQKPQRPNPLSRSLPVERVGQKDWQLCTAVAAGNLSSVQKWLQQGASPITQVSTHHGKTALHLAAERRSPEILTALLATITDSPNLLNTKNSFGETALFVAARSGNLVAYNALLEAGADATIANKKGITPAQCFARSVPSSAASSGFSE